MDYEAGDICPRNLKATQLFLRIILLKDEVFYIFIIYIRFWFYILSLMAVVSVTVL